MVASGCLADVWLECKTHLSLLYAFYYFMLLYDYFMLSTDVNVWDEFRVSDSENHIDAEAYLFDEEDEEEGIPCGRKGEGLYIEMEEFKLFGRN